MPSPTVPPTESARTSKRNDWPRLSGTVVCIASGPSLTAEQIAAVRFRNLETIAVNDVGLESRLPVAAPWARVLYAADAAFWFHHRPAFAGFKVCAAVSRSNLHEPRILDELVDGYLETSVEGHDYRRPDRVSSGSHSGIQALELAVNLGAERVLLLGYDCKDAGRQTNYFGRKPGGLDRDDRNNKAGWPGLYARLKLPVEVVNCTPGSAIEAFPFGTIEGEP